MFNETELRADFAYNGGRVFLAGADGCDHLRGVQWQRVGAVPGVRNVWVMKRAVAD